MKYLLIILEMLLLLVGLPAVAMALLIVAKMEEDNTPKLPLKCPAIALPGVPKSDRTDWIIHWIAIPVISLVAIGVFIIPFYPMLHTDSLRRGRIEATVQGLGVVPHLHEFKKIFPNTPERHSMPTYAWDNYNYTAWTTEIYFAKRYKLNYYIPVAVDCESRKVLKATGAGEFCLSECDRSVPITENGSGGRCFTKIHEFTEEDWNKVVAANGDFSVINIHLNMNSPVPHFKSCVPAIRDEIVN